MHFEYCYIVLDETFGDGTKKVYYFLNLFSLFVIPFFIILILYTAILVTLKKRKPPQVDTTLNINPWQQRKEETTRRVLQLATAVVIAGFCTSFVLSCSPTTSMFHAIFYFCAFFSPTLTAPSIHVFTWYSVRAIDTESKTSSRSIFQKFVGQKIIFYQRPQQLQTLELHVKKKPTENFPINEIVKERVR